MSKTVYTPPDVALPTFFELDWTLVTRQGFREIILDMFPENVVVHEVDLEQAINEPGTPQDYVRKRAASRQLLKTPQPRRDLASQRRKPAPTPQSPTPASASVVPASPLAQEELPQSRPPSQIYYEHFVAAALALNLQTAGERGELVRRVCAVAGVTARRTERLAQRLRVSPKYLGKHLERGLANPRTLRWIINTYRSEGTSADDESLQIGLAPASVAGPAVTPRGTQISKSDLAALIVGLQRDGQMKAGEVEEFVRGLYIKKLGGLKSGVNRRAMAGMGTFRDAIVRAGGLERLAEGASTTARTLEQYLPEGFTMPKLSLPERVRKVAPPSKRFTGETIYRADVAGLVQALREEGGLKTKDEMRGFILYVLRANGQKGQAAYTNLYFFLRAAERGELAGLASKAKPEVVAGFKLPEGYVMPQRFLPAAAAPPAQTYVAPESPRAGPAPP
ncbi:MAG TPA: hypothetical protein VJB68_07615, partial [Methylophilaceae bacterium]|nr:hypothetical protein [Methylophilaceae bacterium]